MAVRSSRTGRLVVGWVVILALVVPVILQLAVLTRTDPQVLWAALAVVVAGYWMWRAITRRLREAAGRREARPGDDAGVRPTDGRW